MAEKLYYSMGEVAEMFDVKTSLIRHWEAQFSVIRPTRNKKGNRLFSQQDVENLKLVYHLVRERGMTLEGAKKALKRQLAATDSVPREVELRERLERIRTLLVEVREDLKAGEGDILVDESADGAATPQRRSRPVVKFTDDGQEASAETAGPAIRAARKPRRKKEDAENKELFAFYEQSLF